MGILNRWRQFGRRYFWPHLLLGVVAAGFGVPNAIDGGLEQAHLANALPSLSRQNAGFTQLALLQDVQRRPSFTVDYWHQHAIRTVIRHLTIAWAPTRGAALSSADAAVPLAVPHQILISSLNALLTHESKPPAVIRHIARALYQPFSDHRTGIRLAQVQGIRAGPALLS